MLAPNIPTATNNKGDPPSGKGISCECTQVGVPSSLAPAYTNLRGWKARSRGGQGGGDWVSLHITSLLTVSEQSGDTCSWGRATGGSPACRVDMGSRCFLPSLISFRPT